MQLVQLSALVLSTTLCSGLRAQHAEGVPLDAAPVPQQHQEPAVGVGIGTEPVSGALPGTRRYNVIFAERSFTLDAFRDAIRSGRTHEDVSAIVRQLEAKAAADYAPLEAAVRALGGAVVNRFWLINACTIEVAPADVARVQALPNVLRVDPDLPVYPLGALPVRTATNASNHNADALQAMGYSGTGFTMAIIDTGQDSNMSNTGKPHVQYYRGANKNDTTGGGIGGSLLLDNVAVGAQPADDVHGHGTGVASIAGASGWSNAGADRGHAPDSGKVGISICNSSGSCTSSLATEALGWQRAAADRAKFNIVAGNMSYGSSPNPTDVSQMAIDACALNADLLPCVSAGNSSSSTTGSASAANGLAVAAVNANSKTMASFSSRGPLSGDTARFYPDIAACGVNTVMAARNNESGNYTASGTSMASPQVCGAAALIKSVRPGSNARELKAMLLCNTEDISGQNPNSPYNSRNAYGMGFLRDDLTAAAAMTPGTVFSDTITTRTSPLTYVLPVTPNQKAAVVLTWYRTNLASRTWSDLNLRILNGAAVVGSSATTRNLYEKVVFTAPASGVVTVEVAALSIDGASQEFSLASTHAFVNGLPAQYEFYGAACAGSNGLPGLSVTAQPTLGSPLGVKLMFARANSNAVLLFGVSDTKWLGLSLPFDLSPLAPGCKLLASGEFIVGATTTASGQATVTLNVPNVAAVRGAWFFNQFVVQDPVNPIGYVLTQGGKGVIGDF